MDRTSSPAATRSGAGEGTPAVAAIDPNLCRLRPDEADLLPVLMPAAAPPWVALAPICPPVRAPQ